MSGVRRLTITSVKLHSDDSTRNELTAEWENKGKRKENLCSIFFSRIQFGATNIVPIAIVPMYYTMMPRAFEDESRAWSRDDLHQILRERIDLLFDCKRETFDNVMLQEKNIMCYTRSQISRSAYGWSQVQAERSTREPLNSTRTCLSRRLKDMISSDQYDIANDTSIYFTSNYYFSRIVRRIHYTSKQHRRNCVLLCNLNTPKTWIFIANTLEIFSRFRGNAIRMRSRFNASGFNGEIASYSKFLCDYLMQYYGLSPSRSPLVYII